MSAQRFDAVWSLLEIRFRMAEKGGDPGEILGALRQMAKHRPDDKALAALVRGMASKVADSPAVVLIESARSAGRGIRNPVGQVYIEEPDGRLRPATGEDLRRTEDRFPGFLKNWSLPDDEYED